MVLHDRFCDKLAAAIKLAGMSQTALGKAMGKSPQFVHNYLVGHAGKPALDLVEQFAVAMGLPPDALISEKPIEEYFSVHA